MRFYLIVLMMTMVVACGGGGSGVPKRVFPPDVRLQELRIQSGKPVTALLRIQNYSTVATRFEAIAGSLTLQDKTTLPIVLPSPVDTLPSAAETISIELALTADAIAALSQAEQARKAVRYRIEGKITSSQPRGRYDFLYESALAPVAGLPGVFR